MSWLDRFIDDECFSSVIGNANPSNRKGVPWYEVYHGRKTVLFGHWPAKEPRRAPQAIGLDTGCVYEGRLTAFIVESNQLLSVPARRSYDGHRKKYR